MANGFVRVVYKSTMCLSLDVNVRWITSCVWLQLNHPDRVHATSPKARLSRLWERLCEAWIGCIQWPTNLPVLMEHNGKCVRGVLQSGSQSCCGIETEIRCPSGAVWIKPLSNVSLSLSLTPSFLSLTLFSYFISLIMLKCFNLGKCYILMLFIWLCLLVLSPSCVFCDFSLLAVKAVRDICEKKKKKKMMT